MKVVSFCDLTGNMVRPWAEAGYECWCVDVQHSIRRDRTVAVGNGLINFVWGDVRSWTPPQGRAVRFLHQPVSLHARSGVWRSRLREEARFHAA